MTLDEARKKIANSLAAIYNQSESGNIAAMVIEHITTLPRVEQIIRKHEQITPGQEESLARAIGRLKNHEPVQYVTNEAWFAGMRLYVDKTVLIPRPETEELIEWIVQDQQSGAGRRILDVGTGSGCMAIALKRRIPGAELWACDISADALRVARMNADTLNTPIDFIELDFLDAEQRRRLPRVDIIVSNPPYVPHSERSEMGRNVKDHEPAMALFVPVTDPLVFYKAIAEFGKEKLNKDGRIYVELHENLAARLENVFKEKGYQPEETRKDFQGKNRMMKIKPG